MFKPGWSKEILPALMKERVVGLDIAESRISVASLSFYGSEGAGLDILGWTLLEPGASKQTIALAIKSLWDRLNIKTRTVCSCLRSPSLGLKYFKYPALSREELGQVLQLEAEQAFQRPRKNLFIDWHLYDNTAEPAEDDSKAQKEGLLVAAMAEDVRRHLDILNKAWLYPVALDINCAATGNLYLKLKGRPDTGTALCLVSLDGPIADIFILAGSSYIYPCVICLRSGLWGDKVEHLMANIEDIIRYHQFKLHKEPVKKIVFTGTYPAGEKFQAAVKAGAGLPIEFWNPLEESMLCKKNIEIDTHICGPALTTALGLAMRNA